MHQIGVFFPLEKKIYACSIEGHIRLNFMLENEIESGIFSYYYRLSSFYYLFPPFPIIYTVTLTLTLSKTLKAIAAEASFQSSSPSKASLSTPGSFLVSKSTVTSTLPSSPRPALKASQSTASPSSRKKSAPSQHEDQSSPRKILGKLL